MFAPCSRDFEARRYKQQSQVKQLGDFLEQISSVRNRAQPTSPGAPGEPPTNNLQSGAGLAGDSGVARPGGSSKLQHYQVSSESDPWPHRAASHYEDRV
jgi:hypothetical protein